MAPYDDTMFDLIFGSLGSMVYLFFKKEKLDNGVRKEIKREVKWLEKKRK